MLFVGVLTCFFSADMNVNSGSSFPIMAAALAPGFELGLFVLFLFFDGLKDSQIVVMLPPKEAISNRGPYVWETYDRGDALRATVDGRLLKPEELRERMSKL
jgi:hypothetical protein